MRYLADTHVFLWWLNDDPKLRSGVRKVLGDPTSAVHVSAASIWEIAIKVRIGKLDFDGDPVREIGANGFLDLPMTASHAYAAGSLPCHHEDPFDRMLIAQAQLEQLVLLSYDASFEPYDVTVQSG